MRVGTPNPSVSPHSATTRVRWSGPEVPGWFGRSTNYVKVHYTNTGRQWLSLQRTSRLTLEPQFFTLSRSPRNFSYDISIGRSLHHESSAVSVLLEEALYSGNRHSRCGIADEQALEQAKRRPSLATPFLEVSPKCPVYYQ